MFQVSPVSEVQLQDMVETGGSNEPSQAKYRKNVFVVNNLSSIFVVTKFWKLNFWVTISNVLWTGTTSLEMILSRNHIRRM